MTNLIIVESPGKIKKIKSFLDSSYVVMASVGHIRDLCHTTLSIDVDNNFKPTYEIINDKKKIIANLRKAIKNADNIYIAADADREGEAIAYHLIETLKIKNNYKRIMFNEITQNAIQTAITNHTLLDINMFYAQQARRLLDRLVGYKLSPLLKNIPNIQSKSLGVGRVQSVVLRLIVDNENLINDFINNEQNNNSLYVIHGDFIINEIKLDTTFQSKSNSDNQITTKEQIKQIVINIKQNPIFNIEQIEQNQRIKNPPPPFITSTLQQEASYKLHFNIKYTMQIAQKLYEKGLITYMRTDSTTLSNDALSLIKNYISNSEKFNFAIDYQFRQFKSSNANAQEAHEAIRPTYFNSDISLLSGDELSLYTLIFNRTVATQLKSAIYNDTIISLINKSAYVFKGTSSFLSYEGYLKIYNQSTSTINTPNLDNRLKINNINLSSNEVSWTKIIFKETYKEAPSRYNESSLVKKLEQLGIGRPSTYANIISKIQEHKFINITDSDGITKKICTYTLLYDEFKFDKKTSTQKIANDKSKFIPTNDGNIICKYLIDNFNFIVDYNFTANMENQLDLIANNNKIWYDVLDEFYKQLIDCLDKI